MGHANYDRMPGERCTLPCELCDNPVTLANVRERKGKKHWTVDRRTARREKRDMKYWVGGVK